MRTVRLVLALAVLLLSPPVAALELEWVPVGGPGEPANPPDDTGRGAIGYRYEIAKYEITKAQWAEFLNAVANETDVYGLYNPSMTGIEPALVPIGIEPYFLVLPGFETDPVDHVSVYDAFRFANWLHNGQLSGPAGVASTEDGAYTMLTLRTTIQRSPGAQVFVPSRDEWYKAAYYDGVSGYYEYPTGSEVAPTCSVPTGVANTANCESVSGGVTDVGSYGASPSPYGTFDQGGNVWEWTETVSGLGERELRGGAWFSTASSQGASTALSLHAETENIGYGFRVARRVPEPEASAAGAAAVLALAALRARRLRG